MSMTKGVCVCVRDNEKARTEVTLRKYTQSRKDRHLVAKSDTVVLFPVSFLPSSD